MNKSSILKLSRMYVIHPTRLFRLSAKAKWNEKGLGDGVLPFSVYRDSAAWDIKRFLEEVGTDAKEARFWLKIFQYRDANPGQPFAVMQVCKSIFKRPHMLSRLASSLAFLQRNGLKTVIVHGLHDKEHDRDMRSGRIRLSEQCLQLADVFESQGAKATPFINCSGVFRLHRNSNNFDVLHSEADAVSWSLSNGYIPIISTIAEVDDKMVHVCPIQATDNLALALKPLKVMYLNSSGGLVNERGKIIEQISIPPRRDELSSPWCTERVMEKIEHIAALLDKMPLTASAVVTSADTVLKELFTHKGSGTIFKRREPLDVHRTVDSIDIPRLKELLERTFKRQLNDNYFGTLKLNLDKAYITESYSAAAIITREPFLTDVPYLDKFVVVKENQGLGSGEILWERIREDYDSLFWRSKGKNRINPWYFARAEGSWTDGTYTVFWYGVSNPKLSHKMIDFAINHPSTFRELWIGYDGSVAYDGF